MHHFISLYDWVSDPKKHSIIQARIARLKYGQWFHAVYRYVMNSYPYFRQIKTMQYNSAATIEKDFKRFCLNVYDTLMYVAPSDLCNVPKDSVNQLVRVLVQVYFSP